MSTAHMRRAGTTLVELLVVLALGTVVIGAFATSVVGQRRTERTVAASGSAAQAADEALTVLVSALERTAQADSVTLKSDTAIEFHAVVGAAVACLASRDSLVLPDSAAGAWWETTPDTGDVVSILSAAGAWIDDEVVGVRASSSGGACGSAHHVVGLRSGNGASVTPYVRISRRVRYMLYRGSDGYMWLGQRTCTAMPARCSSAQPITGPLGGATKGVSLAIDSSGMRPVVNITVSAAGAVRSAAVVIRP